MSFSSFLLSAFFCLQNHFCSTLCLTSPKRFLLLLFGPGIKCKEVFFWQKCCLKPCLHIASKMPSSKLHRRFIEASSNFSWPCTNFSMKCRWSFDDSYFKLILIFLKKCERYLSSKNSCMTTKFSCMTTKNSMKLRWNVDEASMTAFSLLCVNGPLSPV